MENNVKPNITSPELNEKLFDAFLKIAAEEIIKEEAEALSSCEELNTLHPPSPALEKRILSINTKETRKFRFKKAKRQFTKIAAVFAIVFTVSAIILLSMEASRNYIINFFIDMQDDHVVFEFGLNGTEVNRGDIVVRYIPSGFELISSHVFEVSSLMIFENPQGERIIIRKGVAADRSVAIDNEMRAFSEVELNGQRAYLFEALDCTEMNVLIWQYGNDVFTISSHIAVELLMLVAENISLR